LDRDRPAEARRWYERSLLLAQQIGQRSSIAAAQAGLARVLEREGRYAEALTQAQAALQIREQLRDQGLAWTQALVARLRQKVGSAAG
jgi:tetratricopeptide (TPR) repeat protein